MEKWRHAPTKIKLHGKDRQLAQPRIRFGWLNAALKLSYSRDKVAVLGVSISKFLASEIQEKK